MTKDEIRERMKDATIDSGGGGRECEFRANRFWKILHDILDTPEPAASPWNYDLEAAPVEEVVLVFRGDRCWRPEWQGSNGDWWEPGNAYGPNGSPLAWAHINLPEEEG